MDDLHKSVTVFGGGGHAAVVISTLRACSMPVAGICDDAPHLQGTEILSVPVTGVTDDIPDDFAGPAVIAIGNNAIRRKLHLRFPQCLWITAIHPRACVDPTAELGPGTVVFAGAVIQPRAVLGKHVIVNTGATIDHDCRIADFAHIAPGTNLAGEVSVGEGTLVGIGSAVAQCRSIGAWSTVGAGAVVVRDIPDGVTAYGVPARVQRAR